MRDAQPRTFFAVRLSHFQGGVKKLHTKSCISDFWYAVKKNWQGTILLMPVMLKPYIARRYISSVISGVRL